MEDKTEALKAKDSVIEAKNAELAALQQKNEQLLRRSEEHTSELQSLVNLVCRLLLEKKKKKKEKKKKKDKQSEEISLEYKANDNLQRRQRQHKTRGTVYSQQP